MRGSRGRWFVVVVALWFTTAGFGIAAGDCLYRICRAVQASMIELISHGLLASTVFYGLATLVVLACACVVTTMFMMTRSS
ncbi:MAG: hypothetical protein SO053_08365 [Bifidobacterium animalis]|nr:hypothetical protein [Bifidobacterium animalis]MDY5041141.1 hypothetical protein [Bifidobacterium animalis]